MSSNKQRRRRGTGTVEKVGSMWRFKCPDGAGGRYVSPAEYATREEALTALAIYRKKAYAGQLVPTAGLTLGDYAEKFWIPAIHKRRPRSARVYESRYRTQVAPSRLAQMELTEITRRDVRRHTESLPLRRPDQVLTVVSLILQSAVEDELLQVNVARGLRLEPSLIKKKAGLKPTAEEQQALLNCEEIPFEVKVMLALMLGAGDRPGEVWNALLADVHVNAPVPYMVIRFGTASGPAKGDDEGDEPSKVPLFGMALEAMRAWLDYLPTYCPHNPLGLLFPTADGKRRHGSHPFGQTRVGLNAKGKPRFVGTWHMYLKAAGITRPLRLHDMRHGCATDLLTGARDGRRWSHHEVKALLRHSSVTVTEGYLHNEEEAVFRAARESAARQSTISPAAPLRASVLAFVSGQIRAPAATSSAETRTSRPRAGRRRRGT